MTAGISLVASFAAIAPAQAVTVEDFFNDAVFSTRAKLEKDPDIAHKEAQKVRGAGLALSTSTEEYRSAHAGQTARAECLYKNFFPENGPGVNVLVSVLLRTAQTTNKTAVVEGYIQRAMEASCPSSGSAVQGSSSSGQYSFTPTLVRDFHQKDVSDQLDKVRVIDMALITQVERMKAAGDEERGKCIETKIFVGTQVPEAFQTDIMQPMAAAYKVNSQTVSVESIIWDAIVKNCGNESK